MGKKQSKKDQEESEELEKIDKELKDLIDQNETLKKGIAKLFEEIKKDIINTNESKK